MATKQKRRSRKGRQVVPRRTGGGKPHRDDRIRRTEAPGAPPGTLTAEPDSPEPEISVLAYGPDTVGEAELESTEEIRRYRGRFPVTWIDVDGLGDLDVVREVGRMFGIHELTLEDAVHVHQRAKAEQFGTYVYIVARQPVPEAEDLETEQVSIILGEDFVLTFQEGYPGDCFEPVRERIRRDHGTIRARGADYLAYALLDAVTDHYFPLLERQGDRLDRLEVELLGTPGRDIMSRIYEVKGQLLNLRRTLRPEEEAITFLMREPTPLITDETRVFLRDVYDHTSQLLDLVDTYREIGSNLIVLYLSLTGNRMNEVMKVLTVIGSIFLPLTFITGLYGMNFDTKASPWNMPELDWYFGYPMALSAMAATVGGLLWFFRRRGWLRGDELVD